LSKCKAMKNTKANGKKDRKLFHTTFFGRCWQSSSFLAKTQMNGLT
jgi:hypothetical protein